MAHDLNIRADGTASMFSLYENPWHKLGRVLTQELTDDKVAEAAGLNWDVLEKPIYHENSGVYSPIAGEKCLVRADTQQVMAVVSKDYRVFSNQELIQLMRKIALDTDVQWTTAGCLGKTGSTQWVLGYLPELDIRIRGGNDTKFYMLLTNGHGNMRSLQILPTTVRVCCHNTLSAATLGGTKSRRRNMENKEFTKAALSSGYGIHHDGQLDKSVADVVEAYQRFAQDKLVTQEVMEQLCEVKLDETETVDYWNKVFSMPVLDEHDEKAKARMLKLESSRLEKLQQIFASPTCAGPEIAGTAYAALQATTEFIEHHSLRRKASSTSQLSHANFGGAGAKLKEKAFDMAVDMVGAA